MIHDQFQKLKASDIRNGTLRIDSRRSSRTLLTKFMLESPYTKHKAFLSEAIEKSANQWSHINIDTSNDHQGEPHETDKLCTG